MIQPGLTSDPHRCLQGESADSSLGRFFKGKLSQPPQDAQQGALTRFQAIRIVWLMYVPGGARGPLGASRHGYFYRCCDFHVSTGIETPQGGSG